MEPCCRCGRGNRSFWAESWRRYYGQVSSIRFWHSQILPSTQESRGVGSPYPRFSLASSPASWSLGPERYGPIRPCPSFFAWELKLKSSSRQKRVSDEEKSNSVVTLPHPDREQHGLSSENWTAKRRGRAHSTREHCVLRSSLQTELLGVPWRRRLRRPR